MSIRADAQPDECGRDADADLNRIYGRRARIPG
jgi:hypothetical protein